MHKAFYIAKKNSRVSKDLVNMPSNNITCKSIAMRFSLSLSILSLSEYFNADHRLTLPKL